MKVHMPLFSDHKKVLILKNGKKSKSIDFIKFFYVAIILL